MGAARASERCHPKKSPSQGEHVLESFRDFAGLARLTIALKRWISFSLEENFLGIFWTIRHGSLFFSLATAPSILQRLEFGTCYHPSLRYNCLWIRSSAEMENSLQFLHWQKTKEGLREQENDSLDSTS
mmetsp:Transcript_12746/g.23879  ORF Transcript_12746/g.23879 Transcript_12746/m.23879 type:complete len:129 (-) Transcript_12746:696-1082(-)